MKNHYLKTWPEHYTAGLEDRKHCEVRKNDRAFSEGDMLHLQEWDPETEQYTKRELICDVSHILHGGNFGIAGDVVVVSIENVTELKG